MHQKYRCSMITKLSASITIDKITRITQLLIEAAVSTCLAFELFRKLIPTRNKEHHGRNTVVTRTFPEMRLVQMFVTSSTSLL